jgi:hypothetical protein
VAVAGFAMPASWAAVTLTKVTPAVGLIWFAVRGEWRAVVTAAVATGAVALVSVAIAPQLWPDWISILLSNLTRRPEGFTMLLAVPLTLRLPVAIVVAAGGGMTGRRWLVPIAMLVATPDLIVTSFGILTAIPRLRGHRDPSIRLARMFAGPRTRGARDAAAGSM